MGEYMNLKNYYSILIFLIFAGCGNSSNHLTGNQMTGLRTQAQIFTQAQNNTKQVQNKTQSDKYTLIVFVHGTILPLPSPSCLFSSLNDRFEKRQPEEPRGKKSWSDYYYNELRYKTFVKCQPIANLGLEDINKLSVKDTKKYPYTKLSADLYNNSYSFANQNKHSNLHFYTFGWDGRLRQKSRIHSAKLLYKSLLTEINSLKNRFKLSDQDLELILVGHSHGGNVLLNLAQAEAEFKNNLIINKLILLGTPVQSETAEFINHMMFKKIYSFYSTNDIVQIMDILSTQDDISKRRYKNTDKKSKLVQVELEIGNKRPLHNELWMFGDKSNILYRSKLAINPLPAFVFLPIIINEIENKHPGANELLAHIDKDKNKQCFTVKLKNKVNNQDQTITSMPAKIMAFNNLNPDKKKQL